MGKQKKPDKLTQAERSYLMFEKRALTKGGTSDGTVTPQSLQKLIDEYNNCFYCFLFLSQNP